MKYLLAWIILFTMPQSKTIFDFTNNSNLQNWRIVDDVVMGGRSAGNFNVTNEGYGKFWGKVSLENNGGFSSVRYVFDETKVQDYTKIILNIKGDGKKYQFRIKEKSQDYYSYIMPFSTSGEWETIEIALEDMYPSFRGRKLNIPNFSGNSIEELALLIANYKAEEFSLLIQSIELK